MCVCFNQYLAKKSKRLKDTVITFVPLLSSKAMNNLSKAMEIFTANFQIIYLCAKIFF